MNFMGSNARTLVKRMAVHVMGAAAVLVTMLAVAPVQSQAFDRQVDIVNNSPYTVTEFHASNVDRGRWEEDILGSSVLRPGRSVRVNVDDGTGHCLYDFQAVFTNGRALTRYGVNVCRISSWTITD